MSKLRSATVCFSVGVYQIINEISVHETLEMSLVAEAIRRSTRKLEDNASIEELEITYLVMKKKHLMEFLQM